jgi:hypothetical protein
MILAAMLTDPPPQPPLEIPKHLPQEIVDLILSELISLYDHDPAYQWTHFRCLTRFHRKQLDDYFLHNWLPKLTLTLYDSPDEYIEYRTAGILNRTGKAQYRIKRYVNNISRDATRHVVSDDVPSYARTVWHDRVAGAAYIWYRDEKWRRNRLILRMGEGVLNEGYTGGGLLSDMQLPGVEVAQDATRL